MKGVTEISFKAQNRLEVASTVPTLAIYSWLLLETCTYRKLGISTLTFIVSVGRLPVSKVFCGIQGYVGLLCVGRLVGGWCLGIVLQILLLFIVNIFLTCRAGVDHSDPQLAYRRYRRSRKKKYGKQW